MAPYIAVAAITAIAAFVIYLLVRAHQRQSARQSIEIIDLETKKEAEAQTPDQRWEEFKKYRKGVPPQEEN